MLPFSQDSRIPSEVRDAQRNVVGSKLVQSLAMKLGDEFHNCSTTAVNYRSKLRNVSSRSQLALLDLKYIQTTTNTSKVRPKRDKTFLSIVADLSLSRSLKFGFIRDGEDIPL
jgi:hypothetical protein